MSRYIAGVDIGGTSVKFGVLDEDGTLLDSMQVPSVVGDPEAMVEVIARLVEQASYPVSMVGVGAPGAVLMPENLVTSGNLKWRSVPLRDMLTQRLHMPVWVDNDAQTQLAAEWWSGACRGLGSVLYLAFGTGVGGALLMNGKPWRGHRNTAGELGHIITHAGGALCGCGAKGCYEAYASAPALVRMGGGKKSAKEIVDAARAGDEEMMKVFNEYLHEVALGVAGYYMVFRPEAIVLGGGVSAAGEIFLDGVRRALKEIQPRFDESDCRICLAMYRNEAGMRGAAALAKINLQGDGDLSVD